MIQKPHRNSIYRRKAPKKQLLQDAIAYTSVLDAWASSGRCEKALETFQDMKRRKLEVNDLSYNAVWQRKLPFLACWV